MTIDSGVELGFEIALGFALFRVACFVARLVVVVVIRSIGAVLGWAFILFYLYFMSLKRRVQYAFGPQGFPEFKAKAARVGVELAVLLILIGLLAWITQSPRITHVP